jgi:hypothetical protein
MQPSAYVLHMRNETGRWWVLLLSHMQGTFMVDLGSQQNNVIHRQPNPRL